jgi:hypothetical protein
LITQIIAVHAVLHKSYTNYAVSRFVPNKMKNGCWRWVNAGRLCVVSTRAKALRMAEELAKMRGAEADGLVGSWHNRPITDSAGLELELWKQRVAGKEEVDG